MCECQNNLDRSVTNHVTLANVFEAQLRLSGYLLPTPYERMTRVSQELGAEVYVKREDLTPIRSFKVRGALNKLLTLDDKRSKQGVVCASAGNHAQGVAYACRLLNVQGVVFLPKNTPNQKVEQVKYLGGDAIKVRLEGSNFDQCCSIAQQFGRKYDKSFIHPFDDPDVIAGQATVALELVSSMKTPLDELYMPIGGGGLASGMSLVLKSLWPSTKLIGVELEGADAMNQSLKANRKVALEHLDTFAEGTAVKEVGSTNYDICRALLDETCVVSKKQIVEAIFEFNNKLGWVVEPSGALAFAALKAQHSTVGKRVGFVLSGSNNDANRFSQYEQILAA